MENNNHRNRTRSFASQIAFWSMVVFLTFSICRMGWVTDTLLDQQLTAILTASDEGQPASGDQSSFTISTESNRPDAMLDESIHFVPTSKVEPTDTEFYPPIHLSAKETNLTYKVQQNTVLKVTHSKSDQSPILRI